MKTKTPLLFEDYRIPPPDAAQKRALLQKLHGRAGHVPRRLGLAAQFKTQLGYTGLWFWLGLAATLGLFWLALDFLLAGTAPGEEARATLALLGATGPVLAALAAPVLARSYTHGMWELEEAAYHSLPRLAALRLTICFLAALPVLLAFAAMGMGATGAFAAFRALAGPYLLANGVNYFILGRLRGTAGSLCCAGAGLVLAVAVGVLFQWEAEPPAWAGQSGFGYIGLVLLLCCLGLFCLGAKTYIKKPPCGQGER